MSKGTLTERKDFMHKHIVVMILAALCGVATIMVGTFAPASGDEGRSVQFVDTSPITQNTFGAAYPPLPFDYVAPHCQLNASNTNVVSPCVTLTNPSPSPAFNDTLTGDFKGTGDFAGGGVLAAVNDFSTFDIPYEYYEPYSLTVEGCGTGTLILHTEGNLSPNILNGVWRIVPGTGRGGLLGISGSGTFSSVTSASPTSPFVSNYVGHVRCGNHEHE